MKKLILTGVSLLFAITLTFAQQVTPEQKAKEVVTEWTTKLTLNEDQQTAIFGIVLEANKAHEAVLGDSTLATEAAVEQLQLIQQTADEKTKELLSEEQQVEFDKVIAERAPLAVPAKKEVESGTEGQENQEQE